MNNKLNCQLINILLDKDNQFSKKYTSITTGYFDYETLLDNYYIDKDMRSIKVDNNTQSICFTNQNGMVNIYNSITKKNESYYEEVHIHCNNLKMYDSFINYLKNSDFKNVLDETGGIPHYESININNLKECELVMEPMTNEVATTKSLLNLISKNNDETIFRAIAIHFGKLVNNSSEIDSELIHKLNDIYYKYVENSDYSLFSEEISNKFLNIYNDENSHENRITKFPSNQYNIDENTNNYIVYPNNNYDKDY